MNLACLNINKILNESKNMRVLFEKNYNICSLLKKFFFIILFIQLISATAFSQNEPQFTHYMFNEVAFNPAAIGNSNSIDAVLIARKQWYGFEGAPSTQVFNATTFVQKAFGGVGISIINDKIGIEKTLNTKLFYSFPIQITNSMQLALGLGFGFINKSYDGSKLRFEDSNQSDPAAFNGDKSKLKLDFNFGAELNSKRYSIGIASTHLDKSVKKSTLVENPRHYYMYGKYIFKNVVKKLDLVPSVFIKSSWYANQFEVSCLAYYKNMVYGGLSLRWNDAMAALVGYDVTKNLKIGYSYDFGIGGIRQYNSGTHEIMISAKIDGFNRVRVQPKTPRLFN